MNSIFTMFWSFVGAYVTAGAVMACLYIPKIKMILDLSWPILRYEAPGDADEATLKIWAYIAFFLMFIVQWPAIIRDIHRL